MIKGYVCRNNNRIMIAIPTKDFKTPDKKDGRFWHIPGWFHTMSVRNFKRTFGFSIKPGTYKSINILISENENGNARNSN